MNKKLWILAASALLAIFSTGCTPEDEPTEEPKAAPELTKITPAYGYAGDEAVITGANFSATASENEVYFGSDKAEVTTATETSLTVVVPGDEVETATKVDVTVKVDGQTSEALSFTYLAKEPEVLPISVSGINPTEGSAGTEVTISGENFGTSADGITVVFGANTAEIVSVTETAIVVTVPEGDGDVAVIVAKDGVDPSEPVMFKYVYAAVVEVESIYPTMRTEGEEITIIGTGFSTASDDYTVTIGDVEATVSAVSETGINVVVPALAKGEYTVSIKMKGAATVETEPFVYWSLPSYTVSTVFGNGTAKNAEGNGTEALVQLPEGLALSPDGTKLWITTRGGSANHVLGVADLTTKDYKIVVDEATFGSIYPWGLACNSTGDVHVVLKSANKLGVYASETWTPYSIPDQTFKNPRAMIFDSNDYLYISDCENYRIVVCYQGMFVKEIPLTTEDGGKYQPYGLAFDEKEENLFVGTQGGRKLFQINIASGELKKIAGVDTSDPSKGQKPTADVYTDGEVGNPMSAVVGGCSGMCVDADGYLYFVDFESSAVRVLIPGVGGDYTKGMVKVIAGQPCATGKADGDALTVASFKMNGGGGLVMDANGSFYVADNVNNTIRMISPVTE